MYVYAIVYMYVSIVHKVPMNCTCFFYVNMIVLATIARIYLDTGMLMHNIYNR